MKHSLFLFCYCLLAISLSSCKFGRSINNFNDECPYAIEEGITVTSVESCDNGKNLRINVTINTYFWEVPQSSFQVNEWLPYLSVIREGICRSSSGKDLFDSAKDEKRTINYYIYDESDKLLYFPQIKL